jgi:hypothetical protein
MRRSSSIAPGTRIAGRFEALADAIPDDVVRVPMSRTHSRLLMARDGESGAATLLEVTQGVVRPEFDVTPRPWPAAPELVAVLGGGHDTDTGVGFVAREAARGRSVGDLDDPTPAQAVHVALGALAAVGRLHALDALDGRVTRSRLLVEAGGRVRLLPHVDFTAYGEFSSASQPFDPAQLLPERYAGGGGGPTVDVYMIAALLYRLLAKTRHVDGKTSRTMMLALQQPAIPLAHHRRDLKPALCDAVMRALEPDPARRWLTAAAFADALRGAAS